MAGCKVVLRKSFEQALGEMTERARDQVAVIILALQQNCKFEPPEDYILEIAPHLFACEHVEEWGWSVSWYLEDDGVIYVLAAPSTRLQLRPINLPK